ncbi:zinc finger protein 227-like [Colias croceus]|uniref:zinc finger protein 227-like n=1 Tax=Colias crocea TaxID=72248 RepID=UPI001E27CA19|nr:zinc finger protein 227-like [Colias croceus]XP_045509646.1 zinc finger protein 227-like [Colias croceus]XP_045509656.1 zinc finger protein 227-like [Colias croceus]
MDNICRICLDSLEGKYKVSLTDTFKGLRVFKYINYITNIEIKENDGFPFSMCLKCYDEFETAVNFREKCIQSDNKFREHNSLSKNDNTVCIFKEESNDYELSENYNSNNEPMIDVKPLLNSNVLEYDTYECITEFQSSNEDEVLTCNKCNVVFKTATTLHRHQAKNKCEVTRLECDDCGEVFKSKLKMAVHWKKMHLLSKLICPNCKKNFKTFKSLNRHKSKKICHRIDEEWVHIEGVGKTRVFTCKACSYSTKKSGNIIVHVRIHTNERPYTCSICPKRFKQIAALGFHQDYKHKKSTLPQEKCKICGKICQGVKRLKQHIARVHNEPKTQCTICKMSLRKRCLKTHMARHADHKDFTCEVCAQSFYTHSELITHRLRKHSEDKRYTCDLCPYKTSKSTLMNNHANRHKSGQLSCNICFVFVKDRGRLLKHQELHMDGKVFQCPYCHLKYFTNKAKRNHVKMKHSETLLPSKGDIGTASENKSSIKIQLDKKIPNDIE